MAVSSDRLTICFTIFGIFDADENSPYYDIDKWMKEVKERGFNCIRLDCGAGFTHDINGNLRGEITLTHSFGKYGKIIRQTPEFSKPVKRDIFNRLIEVFNAAEKYGIYVIMSSWYYLHTYWFHPENDKICEELFSIPPHERFMAFAKFWDYILIELKKRNFFKNIAFLEIFNEADGLNFVDGYGNYNKISEDEIIEFRTEHENAIDYIIKKYPEIKVCYDSYSAWADKRQIPRNMQIYNYHSYFLWEIYFETEENHPELFKGNISVNEIKNARKHRIDAAPDWYERVALYNSLESSEIPQYEDILEKRFLENYEYYLKKVDEDIVKVKENLNGKDIPVVCGEGVSYIVSEKLLWEEKSEKYWEFIKEVLKKYKKAGYMGTVLRTCCGPEDPSWNTRKTELKLLNDYFLSEGE